MKLVSFLYLLGRDHLPLGVINDLLARASDDATTRFDPHLEAHSRAAAAELSDHHQPAGDRR